MTSDLSVRAAAFVEQRLPAAHALGVALADEIEDPETFVAMLTNGWTAMADPEYEAAQERIAPGSGLTIGVRWPLIHAVERELRAPLRESASASVLALAARLAVAPAREVRLLSVTCLRRTLPDDPERSWQLLRRIAHGAADWISVDTLAVVYAQGVLAEGFRWAEIEQLAYSERRWERRLVGSTLASIPHALPRSGYGELDAKVALELIGSLIGDADDQVQKALSWAVRTWTRVDRAAVEAFLARETGIATATADGNRAWVIRDTLSHVGPAVAGQLRASLTGLRRRPGAGSTSRAGAAAAAFHPGALSDRAVEQQGERFARRGA